MSVYTSVSENELNDFLGQYAIGELISHTGISAGIENTNYFVDTTQGRYILTLFEHHTAEELVYFLDLMATLADASVPTAKPIKQKQGKILSTLNGKPAALVTCLRGKTLDKQEANFAQCEAIGDALAKMHLAGHDFPHQREPDGVPDGPGFRDLLHHLGLGVQTCPCKHGIYPHRLWWHQSLLWSRRYGVSSIPRDHLGVA